MISIGAVERRVTHSCTKHTSVLLGNGQRDFVPVCRPAVSCDGSSVAPVTWNHTELARARFRGRELWLRAQRRTRADGDLLVFPDPSVGGAMLGKVSSQFSDGTPF